jgi:hypothetical protein
LLLFGVGVCLRGVDGEFTDVGGLHVVEGAPVVGALLKGKGFDVSGGGDGSGGGEGREGREKREELVCCVHVGGSMLRV